MSRLLSRNSLFLLLFFSLAGFQLGCEQKLSVSGGAGDNLNSEGSSVTPFEYFDTEFLDAVVSQNCTSCHGAPNAGGTGAPLSLFSYEDMFRRLVAGDSAENNELIRKVTNQISHTGGDQCNGSLSNPPCAQIQRWWELVFGEGQAGERQPVYNIEADQRNERLYGWIADPDALNESLSIEVYLNGPRETDAEQIGVALADLDLEEISYPGHGVSFDLDGLVTPNEEHELYVYVTDLPSMERILINNRPFTYISYEPSQEGLDYYTNTLRPLLLNQCFNCHIENNLDHLQAYDGLFPYLTNPTRSKGGAANNNRLFNRARGIEHGGGVQCQANESPCVEIQELWEVEFGSQSDI
jgi:hypothetical protein